MEALSLVVNSKLVADDVRHSTSGYDEVRRIAAEAQRVQRREHRLWSALRRRVSALTGRRPASTKEVVRSPRLVAQSSGDSSGQH
jgi:hypothetical protein